MIKRRVTFRGLLNISRQVRGDALNGEVVLEKREDGEGMVISPFDAEKEYEPANCCRCRFDQYNRILIPERMRSLFQIGDDVEIKVRADGTLLLLPITCVCLICGSDKSLTRFPNDKFICKNCLSLKTSEGETHPWDIAPQKPPCNGEAE